MTVATNLQDRLDAVQRQNEQYVTQIAELQAQIAALKEALGRNSGNSNKPPSSDDFATREKSRAKRVRRASKRKRGGQPGHTGKARALMPSGNVTHVHDFYPATCEACGYSLPGVASDTPKRHQVTEATLAGTCVTEYRRHGAICPRCERTTWAKPTAEIPLSAFGPRLHSIVVMLTGVYHLSRRQAKRLLAELFGIQISLGAISAIERRMSVWLKATYQEAKKRAAASPVRHTDGTGWRQAGTTLSLWTVATTAVTVFSIVKDGTAKTLRTVLGRVKGILISDRATAINFWAMKRRQVCWAHLLRKFVSFSERDGPAGQLGSDLLAYANIVFDTYRLFAGGKLSRRVFRQRMAPLRTQVEATLQKAADADIKRLSGSCRNILFHRQALWTFVDRLGIEPTNNHAERELRPFVLWRKRSFGTQSDRGNRFAERIMTTVHTLRKQDRQVLPYLMMLAKEGTGQALTHALNDASAVPSA